MKNPSLSVALFRVLLHRHMITWSYYVLGLLQVRSPLIRKLGSPNKHVVKAADRLDVHQSRGCCSIGSRWSVLSLLTWRSLGEHSFSRFFVSEISLRIVFDALHLNSSRTWWCSHGALYNYLACTSVCLDDMSMLITCCKTARLWKRPQLNFSIKYIVCKYMNLATFYIKPVNIHDCQGLKLKNHVLSILPHTHVVYTFN